MSRKHRATQRQVLPDPRYNDIVVTKFINGLNVSMERNLLLKEWFTEL
jgi:ribosomal protein S7